MKKRYVMTRDPCPKCKKRGLGPIKNIRNSLMQYCRYCKKLVPAKMVSHG